MRKLPYLAKPIKGQPCNGCAQEVCAIGDARLGLGTKAPCPLLIYCEGRTFCEVVKRGNWIVRLITPIWLGIGRGCCSVDPEEVIDV
jgi:hypothetical protein